MSLADRGLQTAFVLEGLTQGDLSAIWFVATGQTELPCSSDVWVRRVVDELERRGRELEQMKQHAAGLEGQVAVLWERLKAKG